MSEPAVPVGGLAADVAVALITLGCKVNRSESEAVARDLLGRGVRLAEEDDAAIVVVNTCTVTGEADAKARKAVRRALSGARRPIVVVTGCLAALDRGALARLGERVVVEADKARLPEVVAELLARETARAAAIAGSAGARLARIGAPAHAPANFRTRVALKVEDGCDAFCAYCIVPYARGVPRAMPLAQVEVQAAELVASGTSEIVLTGINVGRYDDGGRGLADVIRAVAASGVARLRLSSIEPHDLTAGLLEVLAGTPSFCAHLHVPLQSGSDAVLEGMGRRYSVAEFAETIERARRALPGLVVTTDVLVGFPGETDEQAAETLVFCERTGFGKLHVFRYSRRVGTPAAERSDQVPAPLKAARASSLRALGERLSAAHAATCCGHLAEVLVERVWEPQGGVSLAEGTTRDYLRARFSAGGARVGDLIRVRLGEMQGQRVSAERVARGLPERVAQGEGARIRT